MSELLLSECDQTALRFVLAAEPLAGRPLPPLDVLERLGALVQCDTIGAAVNDRGGYVVDQVQLPRGNGTALGSSVCDSPLRIGLVHWTRVPGYAGRIRADGLSDRLTVGFRSGRDRVVQVWWGRRTGEFSERDVTVLTMIAPALHRLVRDGATPALPDSLTAQERRTLELVAVGFSNGEIAQRMGVATCTVRKHLEHAYPKLGVTNRLAAAVALRAAIHPKDSREREWPQDVKVPYQG
jgi:DNA-binding CsgD family transcriptional regulator